MTFLSDPQNASIDLHLGQNLGTRLSVAVTPAGILAIAALTGVSLLATTVLVRAVLRESRRLPR